MLSILSGSAARPPDHLIRNVQANHLARPLAAGDQLRQQPRGPSRAATQVEHPFAVLQPHQCQRLLGDADVVLLHLLAAAGLGPLIELAPHLLIDGVGLILGHSPHFRCQLSAVSYQLNRTQTDCPSIKQLSDAVADG